MGGTMKISRTVAVVAFIAVAMVLGVAVGCGTVERGYHQYVMRGQILDVAGNEVYLCVGSRDEDVAGQELDVIRHVAIRASGPKVKTQAVYRREKTGTVRIMSIVDEHYARGIIASGSAEKNSTVELVRSSK